VDSIANAERLSLSGSKVEKCADLWLTQWEHLSKIDNTKAKYPKYKGSVL
jgi:exopolysaccharide biosynthesis glucuronosyltransferase PssD